MMKYAPIVLFVYNRPSHTKKTLSSLIENNLASKSDLYIFSDGPKSKEDKENIEKVREVLSRIDKKKFNNVKITYYDKNNGLAKSVINGVSRIIEEYGKVIVLEDDIVTHPHFLEYMNDMLETYEQNSRIWSISGYIPNIEGFSNKKIVFTYPRGSSWGWATWKDRWFQTDWEIDKNIDYNRNDIKVLNKGGYDLFYMLYMQKLDIIDSWAVRWTATQLFLEKLTIYPSNSYINNIGLDGTGTHGSKSKTMRFRSTYSSEIDEYVPPVLESNKNMQKKFHKLYGGKLTYLVYRLKFIYRNIFSNIGRS